MCSLRRLVWMKIGFLFNIRRCSPLGSRSSEWAQPSHYMFAKLPYVGPIDDMCVRLEAALHRMITVLHQSTARGIKEQMDHYVFESLSRYFDVAQWSFYAVLLQVEHTTALQRQSTVTTHLVKIELSPKMDFVTSICSVLWQSLLVQLCPISEKRECTNCSNY